MDPIKTTQELIAFGSVTSASNSEIAEFLRQRLEQLHFEVDAMDYVDLHGVSKIALAAKRDLAGPSGMPGIGIFSHCDVVSVKGWNCQHGKPFEGAIASGRIWGRGACDMLGPISAALAALDRIPPSRQRSPIYMFITGDEECGMHGARLLSQKSAFFSEMVAAGAVGIISEPTELQVVNSHKGACHVDVSSTGVAAHSSTAEGRNANWQLIPFLAYLGQLAERCETDASLRNAAFSPPTLSLNITVENEPCAVNITVGKATCRIFFRPMPDTAWEGLVQEICEVAGSMQLDVQRLPPLAPLRTDVDSPLVQTALRLLGQAEPRAVSYATDGCCFEQLQEMIVLGPGSIEQAHRPDEWIAIDQLLQGVETYARLFEHYACAE